MQYFSDCQTVEQIKSRYRTLAKQHHPDLGGDEETMKTVTAQMEAALAACMRTGFWNFEQAYGFTPSADSDFFASIIAKIIDLDITIEIIGFWIYAFDAYESREQLKELGFWFSSKHKAWVYSGTGKERRRSRMTLEEIRAAHGSETVKARTEKEEKHKSKTNELLA